MKENRVMNFEVLKKNHLKRNFLMVVGVIVVIGACILTFSLAKYRTTQSIPIVNGTINYAPYDFKVLAMYQEGESGYVEIDEMPTSGYAINESKSYCTVDNTNKDTNAKLYTDAQGQHVFSGLKKNSKCYLYFDEKTIPATDVILAGKDIQTRSSFSSVVTEQTTNRIYQASDSDGTTYYFAGNPTDNWVNFAGFYWRIIRINGDGTIRMIYAGTDPNVTTGTGTQIQTSAFNASDNRSEYVGLKYTQGQQHGNTMNSSIMDILNSWYSSNLTSYASYIDRNAGFCGDRNTASGYSWTSQSSSSIFYAAYERLQINKTPSLECSSSDLFTVTGASKGNASLTNPIGLITADEVAYAGGVYGTRNDGYYLYTNQIYWTMTPYLVNSYGYASVSAVDSGGYIGNWNVHSTTGVRPVINLKVDVSLSGSGTSSDPYVVVGA